MSDRYKGAILSPTAPTVTPQSAGGIYTTSQQLQYQGQGVWPGAVNYPINNSLRFRSSASAYLSRTPASNGNAQKFTISEWIKRGSLGTAYANIFGAGNIGAGAGDVAYLQSDVLVFYADGGLSSSLISTQVFRDPSAWYHIVISVDTTQTTASNRIKIYVNGLQITAFSTANYPSQNYNYTFLNKSSQVQYIGSGYTSNFDGYVAEVNFIDGLQLTPSSFGTTDAYGIWQPIPYTGTYGTNGFYLPFTDNSALTTSSNVGLGKDFSGNGNYWVTNNISITAGSTYDSMVDVPTNTNSNTANYCVMNPLVRTTNNSGSISQADGNLSSTIGSYANAALGTFGVSSGKWYWEMTPTATNNGAYFYIGIVAQGFNSGLQPSQDPLQWAYYAFNGNKNNNNNVAYGASYTTNDVIGVALDMDAGTLTFYKNGTSQGVAYSSGLTGYTMFPMCSFGNTGTITVVANFGQRPFAYTPPTGFNRLNTYNLSTPTILAGNQYMDATLYTGNGSTQSITNSGSMQPDFVWLKQRSSPAAYNLLYDSIRGVGKWLSSNTTTAEGTITSSLTAFNNNGFSVGADPSGGDNGWNASGLSMVGWQWKANGSGSTNTSGTITSTVSANTSAGFSIVTYTGTGTNATVGHGLGVAPSMIIARGRSAGTAGFNWRVYHGSLAATAYLEINTTSAQQTDATVWNSTAPTSSVFSLGTSGNVNGSTQTYVAYCFAQIAGYSAFGSYTGNGSSDGPFVYLGFRPKFFLWKPSSTTGSWAIYDSSRNTYNVEKDGLWPNLSNAETDFGSTYYVDFLSNGFKIRGSGTGFNGSGETIIYAAFAENPFKISRAR